MAPFSAQQVASLQPAQQQSAGSTPPAQPVLPLSFLESAPSLDSKLASFSKSSPKLTAGVADITHGRSALSATTGSKSTSWRMGSMTHSMQGMNGPIKGVASFGGSVLSSSGSMQAALSRAMPAAAEHTAPCTIAKHDPWLEEPDLPATSMPNKACQASWSSAAARSTSSTQNLTMPGPAAAGMGVTAQATVHSSQQQQQQATTLEQLQQQLQELQMRKAQAATVMNAAAGPHTPTSPMAAFLDPLGSSTINTTHDELVRANLKRSTSGILRSNTLAGRQGSLPRQLPTQHDVMAEPTGLPRNRALGSHQLSVSSATDENGPDRGSAGSHSMQRTSSRRGAYPELLATPSGLPRQASINLEDQDSHITISGPAGSAHGMATARSGTIGYGVASSIPPMRTISELATLPSSPAVAPSQSVPPLLAPARSSHATSQGDAVRAAANAQALNLRHGDQLQVTLSPPTTNVHDCTQTNPAPAPFSSLNSTGNSAYTASGQLGGTTNSFCMAQPTGAKFKIKTSLQEVPLESIPGGASNGATLGTPASPGCSKATLCSFQVHD